LWYDMLTRRLFWLASPPLRRAGGKCRRRPSWLARNSISKAGLLGEMMCSRLARPKFAAENRLRLGANLDSAAALLSGAIDLCPEYTGNAAFFFQSRRRSCLEGCGGRYARARSSIYEKNRLVWLAPAPADNSWVIAVPASLAREHNLRTMEDFASLCGAPPGGDLPLRRNSWRVPLAFPPSRRATASGLTPASFSFSQGRDSATMKAAADGISGVNAAMAYATDGALKALDLNALEDTRHAEPVYAPGPRDPGSKPREPSGNQRYS